MIQVAGLLETDFVTVEFDEVPRYDIRTSRDIDATTDGCYVNFTVTLGSSEHGCELELGGFTAARDGRLVVDGVEFLAGADCPMFPDTWEGRYEAEGAELEGSWIEPNPAAIPDPTPGGECVAATVHLRGTLEQQSGPGALTIAGSTLHLARMFPIVEVGAACPIECEADHHCAPSEYCGLDQVCSPGPRYDVRVDGVTNRLEVLQRGEWRGVCWGGWSSEDTEVACRELTGSPTGTASSDGVGNVQAWLASTGCDGSESSLRDCTGSWGHRICPDGSVELRCGV